MNPENLSGGHYFVTKEYWQIYERRKKMNIQHKYLKLRRIWAYLNSDKAREELSCAELERRIDQALDAHENLLDRKLFAVIHKTV
jgi:hypothetical protein